MNRKLVQEDGLKVPLLFTFYSLLFPSSFFLNIIYSNLPTCWQAGIAFPTGCSLNHVAAHYSPNAGDNTVLGEVRLVQCSFFRTAAIV